MEIIESLRIILLVSMLGIAAIFDVKSREIPDAIWLIFGGIGTVLYLWDYDDNRITSYHVITIFTSIFIGIALWRWKIAGVADAFAIFAMTVILPVHYGFVMMPIMILVISFFLSVIFTIMYNVSVNIFDIIRSRKINIFFEFKSEPKHKKIFAFLVIHRKRKFEKFVTPTEKYSMSIKPSVKSFVFMSSRNKITKDSQSNKMYVQSIPPLIAYMFGVAVFLLLPEILGMLFS